MSEPRDFDAEFDYSSKPGKQFKLGGEVFTTKPIAPVKAFLTDEARSGFDVALDFFRCVLIAEDADRFVALINDPNVLISTTQVDQIATWLIGELSGRPTVSPESSGASGENTTTGSQDASHLEVVTSG